jgi:hypothetical protein
MKVKTSVFMTFSDETGEYADRYNISQSKAIVKPFYRFISPKRQVKDLI